MAKRILQVFLVLIFLVLVICGIIVGSYVFSSPNTDSKSESRLLISGSWIDENADRQLDLDENGNFKYTEYKSEKVLAEGYYRINEDRNLIKLFMFPGNYSDDFKKCVNLIFFAQISYSDLKDAKDSKKKNGYETYAIENAPTCTFLVKHFDDTEGDILKCIMPEKTLDLYGKHQRFTAKNK